MLLSLSLSLSLYINKQCSKYCRDYQVVKPKIYSSVKNNDLTHRIKLSKCNIKKG